MPSQSLLRSIPSSSHACWSAVAVVALCIGKSTSAQPAHRASAAGTRVRAAAASDLPRAVEVRARRRVPSDTPSGATSGTSTTSTTSRAAAARTGTERARIAEALREYQVSGVARPVALGAGIAYPFGHGIPLLTCAVLRVCVVELERGEAIVDEPLAGDQARWIIQTARAGPGGRDALVVVKPKACDLATNLVIPTDRRVYDVSLESAPCDASSTRGAGASLSSLQSPTSLTRRVSFYYPDLASSTEPSTGASDTSGIAPADASPTRVAGSRATRNDRYRIVRARRGPFGLFGHKPVDFPWTPRAIVDDGERVYVVAPPEARPHGAPVLYALEDDGSRTIVNVAVRGDTLVSDRTFRRGVLVLTAGDREQRLTFENCAWGARGSAASASRAERTSPGAPSGGNGGTRSDGRGGH